MNDLNIEIGNDRMLQNVHRNGLATGRLPYGNGIIPLVDFLRELLGKTEHWGIEGGMFSLDGFSIKIVYYDFEGDITKDVVRMLNFS